MIFKADINGHSKGVASKTKAGKPVSYRPKREGDLETIEAIYAIKRINPADQMRMAMEALIDLFRSDPGGFTPPVKMTCARGKVDRKLAIAKRAAKLIGEKQARQ